jgi:multidrug efflux pump subunit AcrA (membrane-fusion protein)
MPYCLNSGTPRDLALRGILAALALTALATSGCGSRGATTEAKAALARRPVPITVATVETRPVMRTIEMVGTLKGWEEVTIGTKRAGRVVKVLHDMGDRLEPGCSGAKPHRMSSRRSRPWFSSGPRGRRLWPT